MGAFSMLPLFYNHYGIKTDQIGLVKLAISVAEIFANWGVAAACDYLGSYREVLLASNVLGALSIASLLLPTVQSNFSLVFASLIITCACLASRAPVIDSLTLKVLADHARAASAGAQDSPPTYGGQRLWACVGLGVGALVAGWCVQNVGVRMIFVMPMLSLIIVVAILLAYLPSTVPRKTEAGTEEEGAANQLHEPEEKPLSSLMQFETCWFLINLVVYGLHMALVESFLFIYLLQEFQPSASATLLSASTAVSVVFEIFVFMGCGRLFEKGVDLRLLLGICQLICALRLFLYAALPPSHPELVLLVEPLHGITFAGMWCCSVEYGRRLYPQRHATKAQALLDILYYRVALGGGAFLWGIVLNAEVFTFRAMFQAAAFSMLVWTSIWGAGWILFAQVSAAKRTTKTTSSPMPARLPTILGSSINDNRNNKPTSLEKQQLNEPSDV
ncbi:unnamed protein product [Polarella glacialis]|nr:unnamed protein product [Polarella glacialis]